MKTRSNLLLLILLALAASNTYATITCTKPKLSKAMKHDPIYHFKAVVTCTLVGETIDLKTLKDSYRDEITKKKSQFVVHKQQDYDNQKGMSGYSLDTTQSYDTPHGAMKVRADIILMDDKATNFSMELRSKSIVGEDDAKYDKFILNNVNLQVFPDRAEVTMIKEIDVEEPWYAPDSMFFDTVEPELADSTKKAALLHAQKIRGDKVEAMRK